MAGASKITYTLLWQFFNANKFKRNMYYLLLYSNTFLQLQDCFKIGRALPQLHKNCETFCRSNSRWPNASFDWKKPASGMVLQKFILVNLRCLDKDNLKRTVFTQCFNAYMNQKTQKTTLPVCCKSLTKFFFALSPSTSCWTMFYCWQLLHSIKLTSFFPCALNYAK